MVEMAIQMDAGQIDRDHADTLVAQVMAAIRQHVSSRQIMPGARLPSIRDLAQRLKVSKSTVVDAYDRLVAEGMIVSRRGSGFYIAGHLPPLSLSDVGPRLDRQVDPLWMTRQSLSETDGLLKPGCGWLPASWMPGTEIRRVMRSLIRDEYTRLTDYSTPQGLPALRQLLAHRLLDTGIEARPQQIMLTESGTHAIDLLCRYLVEPGDAVVVDDPCYFNFHAMLRAHHAQVVSVPYTRNGPDLACLKTVLERHRPRLYITNSALQNPTGATLSPFVAHRLLKLAEAHDLLIIEDDIFTDLENEPSPRLAAFEGLERVIHIGSFSKTLSASFRCGFIVTRPGWIEDLVDLKLATAFGGGAFSEQLIFGLLKDGTYRGHIHRLRRRLAEAAGKVSINLQQLGLRAWLEPAAGMFLWYQLPNGLDAAAVAQYALADNVVLAPGNVFSTNHSATDFMRFNVAQSLNPSIFTVLERAMERADRVTS